MASPPHCGFGGSSGDSASDIVQRLAFRQIKSIQGRDHIRNTPKRKAITIAEVRPLERKYMMPGMAAKGRSVYSHALLVFRADTGLSDGVRLFETFCVAASAQDWRSRGARHGCRRVRGAWDPEYPGGGFVMPRQEPISRFRPWNGLYTLSWSSLSHLKPPYDGPREAVLPREFLVALPRFERKGCLCWLIDSLKCSGLKQWSRGL